MSPILVTSDRWINPRVAVSQSGQVTALWEQRLGDDTSQLVASALQGDTWNSEVILGLLNLNLSDIRTWPESHRVTVSWISTRLEPGRVPILDKIMIARQDKDGAWQSAAIIYPPDAPPIPVNAFEPPLNLEVETLAQGQTVGVFQGRDATPMVFSWDASSTNAQLTPQSPAGWDPGTFADFDVAPNGAISAFLISASGLEVRDLSATWRTRALVQELTNFRLMPGADSVQRRAAGGQLEVDSSDGETVVAWQQTDPKYQEDYQVWSASVAPDGALDKRLLYEAVRSTHWTNGQPRIAMDVSDDGRRCLTYPRPPLGTLDGVTGELSGWLPSVQTDTMLIPAASAVPSWRSRLGELTVGLDGCLDQVWSWFDGQMALRLPEPGWDTSGAYAAASNATVAVRLNAEGTNRIQIAQLTRETTPVVTAPGSVSQLKGSVRKGSVRFAWKQPQDLGGADAVTYEWRMARGAWSQTPLLFVTIRGDRGKRVRVEVRAVNEAGAGPISRISARFG
jgi:hypothetical protein